MAKIDGGPSLVCMAEIIDGLLARIWSLLPPAGQPRPETMPLPFLLLYRAAPCSGRKKESPPFLPSISPVQWEAGAPIQRSLLIISSPSIKQPRAAGAHHPERASFLPQPSTSPAQRELPRKRGGRPPLTCCYSNLYGQLMSFIPDGDLRKAGLRDKLYQIHKYNAALFNGSYGQLRDAPNLDAYASKTYGA